MKKKYCFLFIILILLTTTLVGENGIIGIQIIYEKGKNIFKIKTEREPQFFNINRQSDPPGLEIVVEDAENYLKKNNFTNLPENSIVREIKIGKKEKDAQDMTTIDVITRDEVKYFVTKTGPGEGKMEIKAEDYPSFTTWQYSQVKKEAEEEKKAPPSKEKAEEDSIKQREEERPEPAREKEFDAKVSEGQYVIKGLRIDSQEDRTIFRIETSREPAFYNIVLQEDPPGLVIELSGAITQLKKDTFVKLPSQGLINKITVKQSRLKADTSVRLQLTTKNSIKYYVNRTTPSYGIIEILSVDFPKIRSWNYDKLKKRRKEKKEEKEKEEAPKEKEEEKKEKKKKKPAPKKSQKKILEPDYRIGGIMLNYHHDTTRFHVITNKKPKPAINILRHPLRMRLNFKNCEIGVKKKNFNDLPDNLIMRMELNQKIEEGSLLGQINLFLADKPKSFSKQLNSKGMVVKFPSKDYPNFSSWTHMESDAWDKEEQARKAGKDTTASKSGEKGVESESPLYRRLRVNYSLHETDSSGKADTAKPIPDPFEQPEVTAQEEFGRPQVPKVENLELVGVVLKEGEHVGILQDTEGYGYVLSPGDTVENGRVVEVSQNLIKFNISEFGWTREMELKLSEEEKK